MVRLFFEAVSLPRDQITFETDDSGNLIAFNGGDIEVGSDGILYEGSDNRRLTSVTSGSIFSSLVDGVFSSSIDNFKNLQIISSKTFLDDNEFESDVDFLDFSISNNSPFSDPDGAIIGLDTIEPLFMDYRLSHVQNFQFLPPRVAANRSDTGSEEIFGEYTDLNQSRPESWTEMLQKIWPNYPSQESIPQYKTISLTKTSISSNIMCQFFETGGSADTRLKKLDAIDYGIFLLDVGKVFIDSVGQPTFVNLFTMVFSKSSEE